MIRARIEAKRARNVPLQLRNQEFGARRDDLVVLLVQLLVVIHRLQPLHERNLLGFAVDHDENEEENSAIPARFKFITCTIHARFAPFDAFASIDRNKGTADLAVTVTMQSLDWDVLLGVGGHESH